jgi:replicative superfamily II helicase
MLTFQAGLTTEERELVAEAYDQGVLKVCVATCSLAAGINCGSYIYRYPGWIAR